ncbi:MAG: AI-2E family transporter, partial [Oscillospiraceae bacterium]
AYTLNPVLRWIERKALPTITRNKLSQKASRYWGVLLTMLFAIAVVSVFFSIVIPQIVDSVVGIWVQIPPALIAVQNTALETIQKLNIGDEYLSQVIGWITSYAQELITKAYEFITMALPQILGITLNITSAIIKVIVGIIVCVYLLISKEKFFAQIKKLLYAFFPSNFVENVLKLGADSNKIFSGFISGKILDSFIIGILCYIGLLLIGTPYPVLISVIVGVTNIIPYFGPFIGAIPSALFILLISPIDCVWFLIFILFLQQLDGNVIGPKILGDSTGLSAFWVIFSITLFGGIWGFFGMLIGVPLFAVIYSLIKNFTEYRLAFKGMDTETGSYASLENPIIMPKPKQHTSDKIKMRYINKELTKDEEAPSKDIEQ